MYRDIKKLAVKKLLKNKKIFQGLIISYLILIMLFNSYIKGDLIICLLVYFLIFGLNIGGYSLILKMAEEEEAVEGNFRDNFINVVFDNDYRSVFKNEWRPFCFVYIPFIIFTAALNIITFSLRLGLWDKTDMFCLCAAVISIIFFVRWTVKYIFMPYILADRYAGKASAAAEANRDTYIYNKRLIEGEHKYILGFVLSFSGWFMLSCLFFGLGFAVLIPYFREAAALLYIEKRDKYQEEVLKNGLHQA